MPETHVVRRMARRVHDLQRNIAGGDSLPIHDRLPMHGDIGVLLRPGILQEGGRRPSCSQSGSTTRVVGMRVGHDHPRQAPTGRRARTTIPRRGRTPDTCIDQRRHAAVRRYVQLPTPVIDAGVASRAAGLTTPGMVDEPSRCMASGRKNRPSSRRAREHRQSEIRHARTEQPALVADFGHLADQRCRRRSNRGVSSNADAGRRGRPDGRRREDAWRLGGPAPPRLRHRFSKKPPGRPTSSSSVTTGTWRMTACPSLTSGRRRRSMRSQAPSPGRRRPSSCVPETSATAAGTIRTRLLHVLVRDITSELGDVLGQRLECGHETVRTDEPGEKAGVKADMRADIHDVRCRGGRRDA